MKIIFALLLLLLYVCFSFSQTLKENIIIDTDCATDDLRAICALNSLSTINIIAYLTSDGGCSPAKGTSKLNCLSVAFNKPGIPIGTGKENTSPAPFFRSIAENLAWSEPCNRKPELISASELLHQLLTVNNKKSTIVCLGPLSNIHDALKYDPAIAKNINKIIWYNDGTKEKTGSNLERDKEAAEYVLSSGIPMAILANLKKPNSVFDVDLFNKITQTKNIYTSIILESHKEASVQERLKNNHFKLWDELIPVYLLCPDIFDMETDIKNPKLTFCKDYNADAVKEKMIQIFSQNYSIEKNIVFDKFPADSSDFAWDVKPSVNEIIKRYGLEEWKKCVLTNEIHGHLGSYSIIGAKMGIKAREFLGAEVDRLDVYSLAGSNPPLSCMNDGLQISTGATIGVGKIKIAKDTIFSPAAIFFYKGEKVKLTLKKEIQQLIDKDISDGIVKYGNLTEGYWKLIRKVSIKHWMELDRNKIFEISEIKE
ncbi:MAG: nucleoside hydrolase [Bacteroidetes bacterium]|nr:nucleoside hydrolase [Bacteroidota bacterium]